MNPRLFNSIPRHKIMLENNTFDRMSMYNNTTTESRKQVVNKNQKMTRKIRAQLVRSNFKRSWFTL